MTILYPIVTLKFQVTAFFDVVGTEGGVACYVRHDMCFNLRSTVMRDIEAIILDILLPKTKPIFVGIIYAPPNNIHFLEYCNKPWMISTLKMKYFCLEISI